jgi:5'-nucleotidase
MRSIAHPNLTAVRFVVILMAAILFATTLLVGLQVSQTEARGKPDQPPGKPVTIQFLNVADWHGQLDPINVFNVGDVGGAAALSTYFSQDRAANPNTLTLTGGDAYGAAPPLSGFFDEIPAVLAMRLMGFDADTFGNHNFDRGIDHLQEMIDIASAPAGDHPGEPFQYVSANLENRDANLSGVKDYEIFEFEGVKVAVIGLTNPEAPTLVFPGNFGTIEVTDPVIAANEAREAARAEGAELFVIIAHMGVTHIDADGVASGPLIDLAESLEGFDIIFGDHTDVQFEGVINGQLVIENRSKGLTYTRTTLTYQPRAQRVLRTSNEFVTPLADAVSPDPAIEEMLEPFREALAEAFDVKVALATDVFPRGGTPAVERIGEVALGNLIADSMRLTYGTDLALTNGGGIRDTLPAANYAPADETLVRSGCSEATPCDVVVGDVFTILPFGNSVVTREVTGAQLYAVLEHGVAARPAANGRFPQISGFKFTYDHSLPAGSRVVSVELDDGTPILPDGTIYTLATNDFVNAGGDGYTMLVDGQGVTREVMADIFLEYIEGLGTLTPTTEGRIVDLAP